MKSLYAKMFVKFEGDCRTIEAIRYDPKKDTDYYRFIKCYRDKGFHQVILTTDILMSLVDNYFIKFRMNISEIEFMEADDELNEKIQELIKYCNSNRAAYSELKTEIGFLCENSSIDIKKISLLSSSGVAPLSLFFQVNGIICVDLESYENEVVKIIDLLEEVI